MLGALHWGVKRVPLGMLLLASFPSSLCLALIALWTRVRLGNAFIGYMVALAVWMANFVTGFFMGGLLKIHINPLLTLSSYTDRLIAEAQGTVENTPYVDWWWVSKGALVVVSFLIFLSITRRVENLVEAD